MNWDDSPRWRFAAKLVLALAGAALVPAPASAQNDANPPTEEPNHEHLLQAAEPQRVVVSDPRLTSDPIYATQVEGSLIIDGDIEIGTVEEVTRLAAARESNRARQALDSPFAERLGDEERAALSQIAEAVPADDPAAVLAARHETLRTLATAARLGADPSADKPFSQAFNLAIEPLVDRQQDQTNDSPTDPGADSDSPADPGAIEEFSGGIVGAEFRWSEGVVPYVIDSGVPSPTRIDQAIQHWHSRTDRIRFVKRTPEHKNWVRFVAAGGCSSRVGKRPDEGEQLIKLAPGCFTPQVIHEMGHAVGLWHEQSRNDRDEHLDIFISNAKPGTTHNFDQYLVNGIDIGDYDFFSIMQYPMLAFSKNNQATMKPKLPEHSAIDPKLMGIFTGTAGGSVKGLSDGDIAGVEFLYPDPATP